MHKILHVAATALSLTLIPFTSFASDWSPAGPIKLLIGYGAGGGADTQARLIAEGIEAQTGWSILPEQVTGNSGLNLLSQLKNEPANGTAIGMIVTETLSYVLPAASESGLSLEEFTPLTTVAAFQSGLVAMANGKFNTWEAVKAAADAGQTIRIGTATSRQADMAYHFGRGTGVDFNIVEVKGGKAIMNGLVAGDLDIGWVAGAQSKSVKAGEMVNIARAVANPLSDSPDAPAITDLGSSFLMEGHFMFVAPGNLEPSARLALANAIANTLNDPETKAAGFVNRAFGGPSIVAGSELDAMIAAQTKESIALLADVTN